MEIPDTSSSGQGIKCDYDFLSKQLQLVPNII